MMKLFYCQYTRAGRVRWMLEELGAPYELVRVALFQGEHRKPEFLAVNPSGAVPALIDGDLKLNESSAILMHLADKFADKGLAPALGTDARAEYYRWMVYIPATVDPALEAITLHTRILPEEKRIPALVEEGMRRWGPIAKILEAAVDGPRYLVGDTFTAADVLLGSTIGWVAFLGMIGDYPKLAAYFEKVSSRPAFQRAHAD
jgi:glutathione S-transferase